MKASPANTCEYIDSQTAMGCAFKNEYREG